EKSHFPEGKWLTSRFALVHPLAVSAMRAGCWQPNITIKFWRIQSMAAKKSKKAAKKPAAKKAPAKKAAVKKAATKKPAAKAAKKPAAKRKPNAAFMKPMTPSTTLSAVVGTTPMPRTEVTSKLWGYIKKNNLQDKTNKRMINADDKLKEVFVGKKQVSMFAMTKLVAKHLK